MMNIYEGQPDSVEMNKLVVFMKPKDALNIEIGVSF